MTETRSRISRCVIRGSINCDEYFHVDHIVRPGETSSSSDYERRVGGKGANQAVAIARAGGAVSIYGNLGQDGLWIKDAMQSWGIEVQGLAVSEGSTGRALIQVDRHGENSIILSPGTNYSELHEQEFKKRGENWFPDCSHLLVQNEIRIQSSQYAIKNAQKASVFVNPSPLPSSEEIKVFPWDRVDWVIVNADEAKELAAAFGISVDFSMSEVVQLLALNPKFQHTSIVCTLGADGVLAVLQINSDKRPCTLIQVPAGKILNTVINTTGAGDTFTGYFVKGIMEYGPDAKLGKEIGGEEVRKVLQTCVQAAAMCVEKAGTIDSIPTLEDVRERLVLATVS
ncbi:Ribokinase-like protein [Crepidotus variabilis]|uniref:Ribokinase n=1 Tax=Crepidotus variabilis TaxID=179855 RepID=A0A9P6EGZ1_9AGAR|nr:Ribokinase-like protein [Crepidotus variabilis]